MKYSKIDSTDIPDWFFFHPFCSSSLLLSDGLVHMELSRNDLVFLGLTHPKTKKNDKLIWNLGLLTLDVYSCAKIVLFVTKKHFTLCNLASHNVHTQTWNWDSYHHSCFFFVFFIGYGTETSETCPVCVPSWHCAFLEISHHNRDLLQIIY